MMVEWNGKLDEEIRDIVKKNPRNFTRVLRSKGFKNRCPDRTYLLDYIYKCTPLLCDDIHTLKTRVYWVLNHLEDFPECKNVKAGKTHKLKTANVLHIESGYPQYCNSRCQHEAPAYYEGIADAVEKKYGRGIRNAYQIPEVIESLKMRKDELEAKKEATRLKNFGDPHFNNSKQACQTKKEKYGSVWNLEECEKTWQRKYGVSHPMHDPEVQLKHRTASYIYDGVKFDSSWELAVYIWLIDHNIVFEYQPTTPEFWYFTEDGKKHRYFPDFKIAGKIVELKGDNAFTKDGKPVKNGWLDWEAKYKCMLENGIKIWRKKEVQPYLEYVSEKYGHDYLKKFKTCAVMHPANDIDDE